MDDPSKWVDAVKDPLGLTGFILFLVFLVLTKYIKPKKQKTVTLFVFLALSMLSLAGGLMLAWKKHDVHPTSGNVSIEGVGNAITSGNTGTITYEVTDNTLTGTSGRQRESTAVTNIRGIGNIHAPDNKGSIQMKVTGNK